jgi:hypothetical protein
MTNVKLKTVSQRSFSLSELIQILIETILKSMVFFLKHSLITLLQLKFYIQRVLCRKVGNMKKDIIFLIFYNCYKVEKKSEFLLDVLNNC